MNQINQNVLLFSCELQQPKKSLEIIHDEYYIKHGEKEKHIRKIFHNVEYDSFEKEYLKEFKKLIEKKEIKSQEKLNDQILLIYSYNGHFQLEQSLNSLITHLEWLETPKYHTLNDEIIKILKSGIFYHYGIDKKYRPIIFICINPTHLKVFQVDDLLASICCLLTLIKDYMFIKGKVENWIVIIDADQVSFNTSQIDLLRKIIKTMTINFAGTLEKLFILNAPWLLKTSWSILEKLINPETAAKISFLNKKDIFKLHENIDKNQLESKYGGNLNDLIEFWPPKMTPTTKKLLETEEKIILNSPLKKKIETIEIENKNLNELQIPKEKLLTIIPQQNTQNSEKDNDLFYEMEVEYYYFPKEFEFKYIY